MAFKFAESFLKQARLALAGFQKWRALCCRLFKTEQLNGNILKPARLALAGFPNSKYSSKKSAIQ
jgi:hypothetical protein